MVDVLNQVAVLFETLLTGQDEIKQLLSSHGAGEEELESERSSVTEALVSTDQVHDGPTEIELLLCAEVERLRDELKRLREKDAVSDCEAKPSDIENANVAIMRAALEDAEATIESLQAEIRELKQALEATHPSEPRASSPATKPPMQSLSWDEQKKRLMEEGNDETCGDTSEDSECSPGESRSEWEELLIDAQKQLELKDAEIASLRDQLASMPTAPDLDEVRDHLLNADEVVQQERDKLRLLQEEMEEKLRKAEVELSLERARLARDRQAIEELQLQLARNPSANDSSGTTKKRRWLSNLGLDGK